MTAARAALGAKESLRHQLAERVLLRGGRDVPQGAGAMTSLATRGLDDLDSYFTQYLPALVSSATVPLLIGACILWADWVSALIITLTIPLIPIFMILIGSHTQERVTEAADSHTQERVTEAADSLTRLSDHLVELARGLPVLVGLGRAGEQAKALRDVSERYRTKTMTTLRVAFLSSLTLEMLATISVAVVAVFIGVRLVHSEMGLEIGAGADPGAGMLPAIPGSWCRASCLGGRDRSAETRPANDSVARFPDRACSTGAAGIFRPGRGE